MQEKKKALNSGGRMRLEESLGENPDGGDIFYSGGGKGDKEQAFRATWKKVATGKGPRDIDQTGRSCFSCLPSAKLRGTQGKVLRQKKKTVEMDLEKPTLPKGVECAKGLPLCKGKIHAREPA